MEIVLKESNELREITLDVAKKLIKGAERKARELGISEVIAITDEGGNLIACHRMDEGPIASIDIAQNKAWTAVAMKMSTEKLARLSVPNEELYGINTTNQGRLVIIGGGIPFVIDGRIVGAVGVSGSTVSNDIIVASAAIQVFERLFGFGFSFIPYTNIPLRSQ